MTFDSFCSQILRVVYHQPPTGASPSNGSASSTQSEAGSGPKKLYYKSFSPSVLKRAVASGSEDQDQSPPADGLYEDLRQLEEKTNAWLAFSGKDFYMFYCQYFNN